MLFSTDKETHELATKVLGLTSFYDEKVFGGMPSKAAEEYGDDIFRKLMFAKVYCVHMVSMLGHNLLFQDVDVVWYKDPLSVSGFGLDLMRCDAMRCGNASARRAPVDSLSRLIRFVCLCLCLCRAW